MRNKKNTQPLGGRENAAKGQKRHTQMFLFCALRCIDPPSRPNQRLKQQRRHEERIHKKLNSVVETQSFHIIMKYCDRLSLSKTFNLTLSRELNKIIILYFSIPPVMLF